MDQYIEQFVFFVSFQGRTSFVRMAAASSGQAQRKIQQRLKGASVVPA